MNIKIVSRYDDKILLSGKYKSVKDCLESNRGANLRGADLSCADLREANLGGAYLRGADLGWSDLGGAYLREADLGGADLHITNLGGAYLHITNLRGADLRGADLRGADLRGANLGGAYLGGAKNYSESHDFFQEIVRRQKTDLFTDKEWVCVRQICIHRLCWESIRKRFNKTAMEVFKKLAKVGFAEWEKVYKEEK